MIHAERRISYAEKTLAERALVDIQAQMDRWLVTEIEKILLAMEAEEERART